MKIITVRRISQAFFFVLFVWFCIVTTFGVMWWQLRGWPINLFLQLDPLIAVGTLLTTHTLYWPLLWALVTIVLTIIFGRFFCSWVCPFGSMHHFLGYLSMKNQSAAVRIKKNRYTPAQQIKYFILIVFLVTAAFPTLCTSLQTGLLDPIPLVTRSVNLVLLPIADTVTNTISASPRFYEGAWAILFVFFVALSLNFVMPRFYCRFICPLGALFGILAKFTLWRIGKNKKECSECMACEQHCGGGCHPAGNIRFSECILCFTCREVCQDETISYQLLPSPAGETASPDINRRGFVISLLGGLTALPAVRLSNSIGENWQAFIIRPPGSLSEEKFLLRCIKCGQCMRICPTNVIQPGSFAGGLENLWTPVHNNRIGTSGCQLNCTACGLVCPTAAIRPISLSEKLGLNEFAETGPIKIGTAFIDRSRCLPWAMEKPCIVCQENCPVSPKSIYTRESFEVVRDGRVVINKADNLHIETEQPGMKPGGFATGDYYFRLVAGSDTLPRMITANTEDTLMISPEDPWSVSPAQGSLGELCVRLQKPFVDIEKCIGCGTCEHECPVNGKRAVTVSAEGESRSLNRTLLLSG